MDNQQIFKALVNRMTNKENTHWSRAGYPGLKGKDYLILLEKFPQLI